jgi:hypothetical protein
MFICIHCTNYSLVVRHVASNFSHKLLQILFNLIHGCSYQRRTPCWTKSLKKVGQILKQNTPKKNSSPYVSMCNHTLLLLFSHTKKVAIVVENILSSTIWFQNNGTSTGSLGRLTYRERLLNILICSTSYEGFKNLHTYTLG